MVFKKEEIRFLIQQNVQQKLYVTLDLKVLLGSSKFAFISRGNHLYVAIATNITF